ncbi:dTDP-4-amino-4,6-dideoxygalactose transaminase [Pantoea alhagi]|uniref:DegT/DnrJ/EryC1/StrS family aminotransferase n=1 Tax=Mixta sp. BE291 TaxID=3158787 RepID=UPI002863E2B3|nr:dTDP-4-amino-4,6-dideoxygalactose transaminase [Pantoea alhagi]
MLIKYLDLTAQYRKIQSQAEPVILDILKSGNYCLGEYVASFENDFAAYCDTKFCVTCNSGTSALHMALLAAGIKEGDEVITTTSTFVATVAAIRLVKATPVLLDISLKTLNLSTDSIEPHINHKTKAVIAVHLHGNPCEIDEINRICRKYNLILIEDAAQAHGSTFKGVKIGSVGDMACFSFYPGKNLGACGEGGAVITNNSFYAEKLRMIRDWGCEKKYIHLYEGYNYRMDAIQGALLGIKLQYLEEWTELRIQKAELYKKSLAKKPLRLTQVLPEARHVYHVFAVMTEFRDELKKYLYQHGIETGIHYPVPVHKQPIFSGVCKSSNNMSNSETACGQLLSLPIYPELDDNKIIYIADVINEFYIRT